jgi:hypothetical protein
MQFHIHHIKHEEIIPSAVVGQSLTYMEPISIGARSSPFSSLLSQISERSYSEETPPDRPQPEDHPNPLSPEAPPVEDPPPEIPPITPPKPPTPPPMISNQYMSDLYAGRLRRLDEMGI